jgi:threonine/homoserine/homoserine lactone efflux protein
MSSLVDVTLLPAFIATFFFVSLTPGLCMTLAMTLGLSVGVKRTFAMMGGELLGVALVSGASVVGVAAILMRYPSAFLILKYLGGVYLLYLGVQMWRSKGRISISTTNLQFVGADQLQLALQGFFSAVSNPKAWAFMVSLLPPFINNDYPLYSQMAVYLGIILVLEFICLCLYASGGSGLRRLLKKNENVRLLNRIAGSLMMLVGVWLALGQ